MLIEHMTRGLSYASFAGLAKVHRAVLYAWEAAYPEFKEAKAIGESASLLWWETQGRDGVWNITTLDDKGKPLEKRSLNGAVWYSNMKNRFDWRDSKEPHVHIDAGSGKGLEVVEKYLGAIDASINERGK